MKQAMLNAVRNLHTAIDKLPKGNAGETNSQTRAQIAIWRGLRTNWPVIPADLAQSNAVTQVRVDPTFWRRLRKRFGIDEFWGGFQTSQRSNTKRKFAGLRSSSQQMGTARALASKSTVATDLETKPTSGAAAAIASAIGYVTKQFASTTEARKGLAAGNSAIRSAIRFAGVENSSRSPHVSSRTVGTARGAGEMDPESRTLVMFCQTVWENLKKTVAEKLFNVATSFERAETSFEANPSIPAQTLLPRWIEKQIRGASDSNSVRIGPSGATVSGALEECGSSERPQGENQGLSFWLRLQEILKNAVIEGSREAWDKHLDIVERVADNGGRFVFEDIALSMGREADKARKAAAERVRALERAK